MRATVFLRGKPVTIAANLIASYLPEAVIDVTTADGQVSFFGTRPAELLALGEAIVKAARELEMLLVASNAVPTFDRLPARDHCLPLLSEIDESA